MKYSVEILKIQADPTLTLADKEPRVKEILDEVINELEKVLFFIEEPLRELVMEIS